MTDEYKYEVRGYPCQSEVGDGSVCEIGCDTLKEAKNKARYILTEGYRDACESSRVLGYSMVINRFTGECVSDHFNIGICQDCGKRLDYPNQRHLRECNGLTFCGQED